MCLNNRLHKINIHSDFASQSSPRKVLQMTKSGDRFTQYVHNIEILAKYCNMHLFAVTLSDFFLCITTVKVDFEGRKNVKNVFRL